MEIGPTALLDHIFHGQLEKSVQIHKHPADTEGLRYVHRASNLEDVFIKLTGRELRD